MKKYPIYIVFIALLFASCDNAFEQVVSIDIPEHEPQIAVNGHFIQGDYFLSMLVTHSLGILDTANYKLLQDADVKLFHEDNLLYDFEFTEGDQRFFKESNDGLPDGNYRLEIAHPDYKTATVEQVMPKPVSIVSADYERNGTLSIDGERVDEIQIVIDDPATAENFYILQAEVSYRHEGDTTLYYNALYMESNDPIVGYSDDGPLFSDGTFNGNKQTLLFYAYNYYFGENTTIEKIDLTLQSLSKDRYLYLRSIDAYYNADGNPFAEPVVVHNNVENGFGIFSLSARSRFTLEF